MEGHFKSEQHQIKCDKAEVKGLKDKKFHARQQSEQRDYTLTISGKIRLGQLTIGGNLVALNTELTQHQGLSLLYPQDYHDTKKAGEELNFTDKKKALAVCKS
jgi:hypothetical protein